VTANGERRWVDAVTIDVSDLDSGTAFWGGLLGLGEVKRREQYAFLADFRPGVPLILQEVDDAKVAKNRMHFEVHSEDPPRTIAWVLENGGQQLEEHVTDWYSLVVMTDPDGNEFCVNNRPLTAPRDLRQQ
jgi:catechol 2,3-dioxygenase-like lactoylglutathione lyase family enzyme